jgi:hypothetical protein
VIVNVSLPAIAVILTTHVMPFVPLVHPGDVALMFAIAGCAFVLTAIDTDAIAGETNFGRRTSELVPARGTVTRICAVGACPGLPAAPGVCGVEDPPPPPHEVKEAARKTAARLTPAPIRFGMPTPHSSDRQPRFVGPLLSSLA